MQLHPLVEHGVGLAAEHVDVVAQVDERLGEVPRVDALAADVGLAPVREVGDAQRIVRPRVHGGGAYRRVTRRSEAGQVVVEVGQAVTTNVVPPEPLLPRASVAVMTTVHEPGPTSGPTGADHVPGSPAVIGELSP